VPGDDRKLYVDVEAIKEVADKVVEAVPPTKRVPDARRPMADMELEEKLMPEPVKTDIERFKTNLGIQKGRHGALTYLLQKAKAKASGVGTGSGTGTRVASAVASSVGGFEEDLTLSI
jgi:transcription initiation factor TFIIIB Brf1 subunit/transcription initiation factor TFIIB